MSAPNVNGYRRPDPIKLANVTVQAVDQIGIAAADEIEKASGQILEGATEIAGMLRDLANAIRQQSNLASEQVNEFCGKATAVIAGVRDLQARISPPVIEAHAEDDGAPVPKFLAKPMANELQ